MSNIRKDIIGALAINETHVRMSHYTSAALTDEEKSLLEALSCHPAFAAYPKDQIDRHTLKSLMVAISDQPVSLCERVASKAEKLIAKGVLTESLTLAGSGKFLTEAEEVPVERPEIKDGDGEPEQGPADSTADDHEGDDVGPSDKDAPEGEADKGTDQDKESHGDKSDVAQSEQDGYKHEESRKRRCEADDVEHGHDEEDSFQLEQDEEDPKDEEPKKESKKRRVKEQDAPPLPPPAANEPAPKTAQVEPMESEEVPQDAPSVEDPAHRAANDATHKDGTGQNEAAEDDNPEDELKEDDLDRPDQTKDVEDPPDLDKVQPEDPAKSELDQGPADPKLESLSFIEKRICNILREAGIQKGSRRWTEAYVRGWSLAMEHRANKLSSKNR